jgi:Malectin domain
MSNPGSTALGRVRKGRSAWAIAFVLALLAAFSLSLGTATRAFADPSNAGGVSIDAGGSGDGGSFVADEYNSGGLTASNTTGSNGDIDFSQTVSHPIPQADWNTYRYLANDYTIPDLTPDASYQVRLYFLDWYFTETGQREFNVAINGTTVLSNFDIVQAAVNAGGDGDYIGVEEDFTETADANGVITIAFSQDADNQPMVNAIAVVPSS